MMDGQGRVRAALAQLVPAAHTPVPFSLVELFAEELGHYAELIAGPGGTPVGFMVHGEGAMFTERVRIALEQLELPAAALAHHQRLARWFEHKRGFFKVEWHRTASGETGASGGAVEPLAAIYFRRRPPVAAVLEQFTAWDVPSVARQQAAALGGLLDKEGIHFVSAAFRPDRAVHHKLYFSQWVTPETRPQVTARIGRVFERYGFAAPAIAAWREHHERCLLPDESTVFVSMSCSNDGLSPSFKIDYPEVPPTIAAEWLPVEQRAAVLRDADALQRLAGIRHLSFLGVRFDPDRATPSLKYYCDVPAAPSGEGVAAGGPVA